MEPRIAELLVRGALITREQLQEAVDKQKKDGTHLVQELVRSGHISEDKLIDFFAQQFGIEKFELANGDIPEAMFNLVPSHLMQKHQLVPVKLVGSTLTVAMSDPTDLAAVNEVKFLTGYGVR